MVQKAHSKAPPENPVPKQPEKPTANQKPPMKIVTTGAAVSEIQTNMAALRERFSSSNRDIFNPFEKEFLRYLGIGSYKVADTRFGFLFIWILTNVRVSVWCACMEILHRVLPCWKAASLKQ